MEEENIGGNRMYPNSMFNHIFPYKVQSGVQPNPYFYSNVVYPQSGYFLAGNQQQHYIYPSYPSYDCRYTYDRALNEEYRSDMGKGSRDYVEEILASWPGKPLEGARKLIS
jgi:hypothetical protein